MSEDEESDHHNMSSSSDSDYSSSDIMSDSSDSCEAEYVPQGQAGVRRVYFVFWSALLELFALCCCTQSASKNILTRRQEFRTMIIVEFTCQDCNAHFKWKSQQYYGTVPAGNIPLSASVFFAGATVTKV